MSVGTSTGVDPLALGTSNAVTFASNGTACVLWYDGTNIKMSYASSPYTSWTSSTVSAAGGIVASTRLDTSDTVNTIFYVSGGLDYAPITLSGTTYSVGSLSSIATVASGGNNLMGCVIEKDPQNRYWAVVTDRTGANITAYTATSPGGTWTNNHSVTWSSDLLNNFPAGGIVGNYLLFLYPSASSTFDYQRLDVHNASLGSWSAATAFTPGGSSVTYDNFMSFRGNSTAGVEANSSGSGIWARVYNPSTDTWASAVQLSSGASDTKPTVVSGSDGNLYVFWMSFVATNNYAILYKKYNVSGSTWDSSATTLVASGANNVNPVGGSSNGQLGILYQSGTASPYTVNFTSFSFLTTTTYSFTDGLTASDSTLVTDAAQVSDALSVSDIGNLQSWPVDALTASDSILITDTALPLDALSVSDALLQTDTALPVDALTISDIGALQSWSVDALTITDSALIVDVALPIDTLSANDSMTTVEGAALVDGLSVGDGFVSGSTASTAEGLSIADSASYADAPLLVDGLLVNDVLLKTDAASVIDALSIADSALSVDGAQATDNLTIADIGNLQSWPVDALSISDSLLQTDSAQATDSLSVSDGFAQQGASSFADNLSASDALLSTDSALATDSNTISDSVSYARVLASTEPLVVTDADLISDTYIPIDALSISSIWVSGPANNQMASTDSLNIVDLFFSGEASAFSDVTPCSDQFLPSQVGLSFDALVMTDTASYAEVMATTEPLTIGESGAFSDAFMGIEALLSSDSIAGGYQSGFTDGLNVADLFTQSLAYNQTEPLSALDNYLAQQGIALLDLNVLSDASVFASGLVSAEQLSASSQFTTIDLAIWLEQNSISDSFTGHSNTTNVMAFTDSLVVSDVFIGTGAFKGLDLLSITDTSTMTGSIVPAKVFVQALTRDGLVLARGKSGWTIAQSRDGAASANGQSGRIVGLSKDAAITGRGR